MLLSRASFFCLSLLAFAACGDDPISNGDARGSDAADILFPDATSPDTADTRISDSTAPDTTAQETAQDTNVAETDTSVAEIQDTTQDTTPDTTQDTAQDTTVAETVQDTSVADTAPETTADTSVDTSPDTTGTCDNNGFTSAAQDGLAFDTGDVWYLAQSTLGAPVDVLSIEIYADLGGATTPGTYPLSDENYDTCGNCVLIQTDCDANLNTCDKTFLATGGTLTIVATGGIGDAFTASLSDLVFTEITYDADYHSTPVAGGEDWCIEDYSAEVILQ